MDKTELLVTADLAHIELSEDELDALGEAVSQMIEYFARMNELSVEGLEPTTHALLMNNRVRPDVVKTEDLTEAILENAPELEDRLIVIPNVL